MLTILSLPALAFMVATTWAFFGLPTMWIINKFVKSGKNIGNSIRS